ncbi:cytosolic protein [Halobacillus sp. MO56]
MKKFVSKYFTSHSETREHHQDEALQTHYFKTTKDKALQAVKEIFDSEAFTILSTSEEHGEISVNYKGKKKAFIVASIVMVKPFRTAVDFSVTTESGGPVDFGFSRNLIIQLNEKLKKRLTYIESSMANKLNQ